MFALNRLASTTVPGKDPTVAFDRSSISRNASAAGIRLPRSLQATKPAVTRRQIITAVSTPRRGGQTGTEPVPTVWDLFPSPPVSLIGAIPLAIGIIGAALLASWAGIEINLHANALCGMEGPDFKACEEIPCFMKVPLIATHLVAFGLMPTGMWVIGQRATQLKSWGAKDPFVAQLGLGFLMVSIAGEIGWHVTQHWFYQDEWMIMNTFFYVFLVLGTALWAVGVQDIDDPKPKLTQKIDLALLAATPATLFFYWLGAYLDGIGGPGSKVPIFIILTIEYIVLSIRLRKLLDKDNRIWAFPFFSVVVNLTFIALLAKNEESKIWNPFFHICHDLLGTELGAIQPASAQGRPERDAALLQFRRRGTAPHSRL